MGRRAAGEGTIYKMRDGRFAAMLTIGYADGKQKRKKFEGRTRKEVAEKLAIARRQLELNVDLSSRQQPLRVFLTRWFDDVFTASTDRPRSISTYKQMLEDYIKPSLGDVALQKVNPQHIQQFLAEFGRRTSRRGKPFARSTVKLARTVLRQALQQAVDWKLIPYNPVLGVKAPKLPRRAMPVLTVEQARALLAAIRGERLECAIQLALMLGLRRGEVCGITWADVDLDQGILHVRGNVQYVPGTGLCYGPPKSDSGQRSIKLPATLLASLRWHQQRQKTERAAMGERWQITDFVFVSSTNGGMLNPVVLVDAYKRARTAANVPETICFHQLRHSCASFLIAQNVHPKIISGILGHATVQITMDLYGHLLPGAMDEAAGQVEALLNEKRAVATI